MVAEEKEIRVNEDDGAVAEKFADIVFITDDNPRNEDPASIRNEIASYCKKSINVDGRKKQFQKL